MNSPIAYVSLLAGLGGLGRNEGNFHFIFFVERGGREAVGFLAAVEDAFGEPLF